MKIRMKFSKIGPIKFIGHLDVMRYFQKAFRRAKVDIAYSKGFSPHQIISFAAPLGIGLTSEGEYLDAEFLSTDSTEVMMERLNAVMNEGITVLEYKLLPEDAKNAMSTVAAADYEVTFRPGYYNVEAFLTQVENFLCQEHVMMTKETKKSTQEVDILPMIYEFCTINTKIADPEKMVERVALGYALNDQALYLKVKTGSAVNLKPELVMEAFCQYLGFEYEKNGFMFHRLDTYMENAKGELVPLGAAGSDITAPIKEETEA